MWDYTTFIRYIELSCMIFLSTTLIYFHHTRHLHDMPVGASFCPQLWSTFITQGFCIIYDLLSSHKASTWYICGCIFLFTTSIYFHHTRLLHDMSVGHNLQSETSSESLNICYDPLTMYWSYITGGGNNLLD